MSGKIIAKPAQTYIINPIKYEHKYLAECLYEDVLAECLEDGCISKTSQEFELKLFRYKLPFNYKELLEKGRKDIEDAKVELYEIFKEKKQTSSVRKKLEDLDNNLISILSKLHFMDSITAEGVAEMIKSRYLLRKSIKKSVSDSELESIMMWLSKNSISETIFRQIARSNTFFNLNTCTSSLFQNYPLTDEQTTLMYWYRFYKNVLEHSEKPFDWIIEDDLALDGWYILQSRKGAKSESVNYVEGKIHSSAVAGSQEVYIMGGAKMNDVVYNANNAGGKAYIKAKQNLIDKGKLSEHTEQSLGQGFGVK